MDKESERYYDVSTVGIKWEGKKSLIVIFNEVSNSVISKRLEEI